MNTNHQPHLESWLARGACFAIVVLSAWIGWTHWMAQGALDLAILTLCAEIVAFAGLALAAHHWKASKSRALGAALLTLVAAAWCAFTVYAKLDAAAQVEARAIVERTPAFKDAKADAANAEAALAALVALPTPTDIPAVRLEVWAADRRAKIAEATAERDRARAARDALIPEPTLDRLAAARAAGVELLKLFGLVVFGVGGRGKRRVDVFATVDLMLLGLNRAPNVVPIPNAGAALAGARWGKRKAL